MTEGGFHDCGLPVHLCDGCGQPRCPGCSPPRPVGDCGTPVSDVPKEETS